MKVWVECPEAHDKSVYPLKHTDGARWRHDAERVCYYLESLGTFVIPTMVDWDLATEALLDNPDGHYTDAAKAEARHYAEGVLYAALGVEKEYAGLGIPDLTEKESSDFLEAIRYSRSVIPATWATDTATGHPDQFTLRGTGNIHTSDSPGIKIEPPDRDDDLRATDLDADCPFREPNGPLYPHRHRPLPEDWPCNGYAPGLQDVLDWLVINITRLIGGKGF